MKLAFNPVILIPHYNHSNTLISVINDLRKFNLPILIVDDGSDDIHISRINHLAKQENIFIVYRDKNGGKGAAVKNGLLEGIKREYSHAIQVDADGQHNLDDITEMLKQSRSFPNAVVCGRPIYGKDAPKSRLYGRKITNFWIMVNTKSTDIVDGMCGFRIYPLMQTAPILQEGRLGNRMDFDIEILVRLHWQKVPIIWVDTLVKYESNGVSHFKAWKDNWLISKMHARLFFLMLVRVFSGKSV